MYMNGKKNMTAKNLSSKICENDSSICKELRNYKHNELLAKKRTQQLRENSHELRKLERQLQSAMISKQLKEQLQSIAYEKGRQSCAKQEEKLKFSVECKEIGKSILLEKQREQKKKKDLFTMLKAQMNEIAEKRRLEFENTKYDSEKMENLMNKIQAETEAQHTEAKIHREKYKREMEESHINKQLQKQLEKDKNAFDTERILAYQKECDSLKYRKEAELKQVRKEKDERSERLMQQLALENQEKEKHKYLILSLSVEECKAKDEQQYREVLFEQMKKREKLRVDIENFSRYNQLQREMQFKIEEENFQKEHLRYLEERDKIVQLSDEKRRRKKMEHSTALKEMIDIRRRQKANEIALQIADFEKTMNNEKERDLLIKEERLRMLDSVPKELLSYLPPGVLKTSEKEFLTLSGYHTDMKF